MNSRMANQIRLKALPLAFMGQDPEKRAKLHALVVVLEANRHAKRGMRGCASNACNLLMFKAL